MSEKNGAETLSKKKKLVIQRIRKSDEKYGCKIFKIWINCAKNMFILYCKSFKGNLQNLTPTVQQGVACGSSWF